MSASVAMRRDLAERLKAEYGLSESLPKAKATMLDDLFEVEPVPLEVFIKDKGYLGQPFGLGPIQFDVVRHFEQIFFPETYIQMVEEFGEEWNPVRFVNELIVEWGKGAGKDYVLQVCFARVANLLLSLKNPQEYFGHASNSQIHMMNVAYNAPQAQGSFFKPLRNLLVSSPFFKDRFETDEPGPQAVSVRFEKQLELISGHSDADGLEGKNLIAAVADEISAFPTIDLNRSGKPPARSADAIVDMLRSSASTRFPYTHKFSQISYPRADGDAIQRARKEAVEDIKESGDASTYYVSGPYRTWEVNPIYTRADKWITLPGMDYPVPDAPKIVNDYKKRRKYAEAKYECRPGATSNPYYKDSVAIQRAFAEPISDPPPLQIDYAYGVDSEAGETVPSWQATLRTNGLRPIPGALYAIHADMAVTGDRAGLAMCHVKEWREVETSEADGLSVRLERRPVVKVDFAHAFEADAEAIAPDGTAAPRSIQIRWFRKLVLFLADQGFVFGSVSLDGFQSVDSLQILASRGFPAHKVSVDRTNDAWETLGDLMYEGRILGPDHALLKRELEGLTPNGRKVDHPNTPDGSKDVADAVAASSTQAVMLGGQEEEDGHVSVEFSTAGGLFDTFGESSAVFWSADANFSNDAWSGDSPWP